MLLVRLLEDLSKKNLVIKHQSKYLQVINITVQIFLWCNKYRLLNNMNRSSDFFKSHGKVIVLSPSYSFSKVYVSSM